MATVVVAAGGAAVERGTGVVVGAATSADGDEIGASGDGAMVGGNVSGAQQPHPSASDAAHPRFVTHNPVLQKLASL